MSQPTVSLTDISTYLPGEPIGVDYYAQFAETDDLRDNFMFRTPAFRHHVAPDETAIDTERHRDTFDECGNLFGARIPINLEHAISDGQIVAGDLVMMAGFAHAGDFAGAAAVRWGGRH